MTLTKPQALGAANAENLSRLHGRQRRSAFATTESLHEITIWPCAITRFQKLFSGCPEGSVLLARARNRTRSFSVARAA